MAVGGDTFGKNQAIRSYSTALLEVRIMELDPGGLECIVPGGEEKLIILKEKLHTGVPAANQSDAPGDLLIIGDNGELQLRPGLDMEHVRRGVGDDGCGQLVCSFYHLYSAGSDGTYNSTLTSNDDFSDYKYGDLKQCCFTVFRYTLVDDYGYDTLILLAENRGIYVSFTRILISYWLIASSVILLNLLIALLSDTFSKVYENALVVSQFEKAAMIVSIENKLPQYWRKFHLLDIAYNYAPASAFYDDDELRDDEQTTFESDVQATNITLRRLLKEKQESTDDDLNEFLKTKIKSQTELIETLMKRIESMERK
eukprot:sb/3467035/